jgi:hydrogenase/urease accessory protein HupE
MLVRLSTMSYFEENMSRLALSIAALLIASTAHAHTGVGDTNGFVHGFTHPISGIDHILAMVAVGLFATHLGSRALWLVPLSFVWLCTRIAGFWSKRRVFGQARNTALR